VKYYCQYEKEAKTLRMTPMDQKPGAKQVSWFLGGASASVSPAIRSHPASARVASFRGPADGQPARPGQQRPAPLTERRGGLRVPSCLARRRELRASGRQRGGEEQLASRSPKPPAALQGWQRGRGFASFGQW